VQKHRQVSRTVDLIGDRI